MWTRGWLYRLYQLWSLCKIRQWHARLSMKIITMFQSLALNHLLTLYQCRKVYCLSSTVIIWLTLHLELCRSILSDGSEVAQLYSIRSVAYVGSFIWLLNIGYHQHRDSCSCSQVGGYNWNAYAWLRAVSPSISYHVIEVFNLSWIPNRGPAEGGQRKAIHLAYEGNCLRNIRQYIVWRSCDVGRHCMLERWYGF